MSKQYLVDRSFIPSLRNDIRIYYDICVKLQNPYVEISKSFESKIVAIVLPISV